MGGRRAPRRARARGGNGEARDAGPHAREGGRRPVARPRRRRTSRPTRRPSGAEEEQPPAAMPGAEEEPPARRSTGRAELERRREGDGAATGIRTAGGLCLPRRPTPPLEARAWAPPRPLWPSRSRAGRCQREIGNEKWSGVAESGVARRRPSTVERCSRLPHVYWRRSFCLMPASIVHAMQTSFCISKMQSLVEVSLIGVGGDGTQAGAASPRPRRSARPAPVVGQLLRVGPST